MGSQMRLSQGSVAADISPRQLQVFAPTNVGGYGSWEDLK